MSVIAAAIIPPVQDSAQQIRMPDCLRLVTISAAFIEIMSIF
jgi:hypothetical protein